MRPRKIPALYPVRWGADCSVEDILEIRGEERGVVPLVGASLVLRIVPLGSMKLTGISILNPARSGLYTQLPSLNLVAF